MRDIYNLRVSAWQQRALFGLYLGAALLSVFQLQPGGPGAAVALLLILLGWRETRLFAHRGSLSLDLHSGRQGVSLISSGQSYFFTKYKVYACRWFAILRLIDRQKNRTLILTADCFTSDEHYRHLRYRLGNPRNAD